MVSLHELVKGLKAAFQIRDYRTCVDLLGPIKIELIKARLLVPDVLAASDGNTAYLDDLEVAKKILEIGALSSINLLDFAGFENYYAQLRAFYFGIPDTHALADSENKKKLISLYLLILLAQGDVTKFHSELEFLSKRDLGNIEENTYLSYPVRLEKLLMEGSYQKAWDMLQNGREDDKIEEFNIFDETLMNAIRDSIARNTEVAYARLPLSNVKALLFFKSEKDTEAFAKARGWNIVNGCVLFDEDDVSEKKEQTSIVSKALSYATNLESIV
ncbi:AaceriAFR278Wp [[Ashbya] aceris (nom. inval.)]|nr:AaceriAFR278Wp [[Ashbya] aceris (nom. inval.)]